MFEIGEVVVHKLYGLCRVEKIEKRKTNDKKREYYRLEPLDDTIVKTEILLPIETSNKAIRKTATKKEINDMIDNLEQMDYIDDLDFKKRKRIYNDLLSNNSLKDYAFLLKSIHHNHDQYKESGRRFPSQDRDFFERADNKFSVEVAYVLGIKPDEVNEYISNRVGESDK